MDIYHIVLSNACVAFLTAPLRRLRYLLTVEDDLIEEGVLPPAGFGGTLGCIRFLYNAGGRSVSVFYRSAFLEAVGCIGKYELQRIISIPIARRLPLRMQSAFLATTFVHTALVYFTVAPLQTALDTIAVNSVSTFTVEKAPATTAAVAPDSKDATSAAAPARVRMRFSSAWQTTKYLAGHFPVLMMVRRLYLLDFACRYVTSLANNKILNWLMRKAQKHYNGVEMTSFQRLVMYAGCPLVASLAMSLVTYPFATYPVAHFLRLRCYERRAEQEAEATRKAAEAEDDYPLSARHSSPGPHAGGSNAGSGGGGNNTSSPHTTGSSKNNNNNSSTSMSFSVNAEEQSTTGPVERFWWEELCFQAIHGEVRAFLWKSMYGNDSAAAGASTVASTSATPVTSSPTTAAAQQQCPVGAGGRSTEKRGIGQVYRGFGLIVVSTLLSSALAMTLNRAVDFMLHHSH